jgi:hypothetical protein
MPAMVRTLEFHDSTLAAIEVEAGEVVLDLLPGYVHQWEERDGRRIGTGWETAVRIRIAGVSTAFDAPQLPAEIADGSLVVDDGVSVNMVSLPFREDGHILLAMELVGGASLNVAGIGVTIEAIGAGTFLEALPAALGSIPRSVITCPHCGAAREEAMPTDVCVYFYGCTACQALIRAKPGDCCVFCSFGTVPCPPVQMSGRRCPGEPPASR